MHHRRTQDNSFSQLCCKNNISRQDGHFIVAQIQKAHQLPSEEGVVPVSEVVFADQGLNLLHLPVVWQHNHHGSVSLVRQHEHRSKVVLVLVEIIATGPLHHVHCHLGVLIHVEVCLPGEFLIKELLPFA